MAKAEFMIPRPAETDGKVTKTVDQYTMTYRVYRTVDGEDLKWSAPFPLPQIGDRIRITMNAIGPAVVVGYFKEEGFVGVMTKALNPPTWLKNQRARERKSSSFDSLPAWRKEGIGCEFGSEIGQL